MPRSSRSFSALEQEYEQKYKKKITVGNEKALPGVLFGYGLDLSRCIGCRRCVYACVEENNQSKDPQIHWISGPPLQKGREVGRPRGIGKILQPGTGA